MNSYTYFADFYIFAPSFYKKVISMKKNNLYYFNSFRSNCYYNYCICFI